MHKVLLSLFLSSSLVVNAGTLEDFFKAHPELAGNFHVKPAIERQASAEALMAGERLGLDDKVQRLAQHGDDYGEMALREIASHCQNGYASSLFPLKDSDCELIQAVNNRTR